MIHSHVRRALLRFQASPSPHLAQAQQDCDSHCFRDGPLRREFELLGAEIIPSPTDEERARQRLSWKVVTLQSVLDFVQTDVDVIVFNTVLWANVIASGDGRASGSGPRIMWILHEMEITEHSVPRHEKFTTVWKSTSELGYVKFDVHTGLQWGPGSGTGAGSLSCYRRSAARRWLAPTP